MLSDADIDYLLSLSIERLRIIKVRNANAKGGTYEYRVYCFVDGLLMRKEALRLI